MSACLDDDTVLQLVSGTLRDGAAVQEHLDACAACRELVAASALDSAPDWEHLEIGAQLGRYRITEVLGAGAMGYVFAADDPELGRTVALKLLRARGQAQRLLREAQALAKLSHPNVVTVHDVGTLGEHLFVALEWVDGGTLATWLAEPRTTRAIVDAFRQAGEGLAAAHAAGLVHRDVKPDNILVGRDGRVRVTDFGLATSLGESNATGAMIGTPAYASPEQLAGGDADARSDQFSLCVALFEALYGARPFRGADAKELRAAIEAGSITRPAGKRVPRWLDRILARGLARDPAARWPTLRALLDALARGPLVTPARAALAVAAVAVVAFAAVRIAGRGSACARVDAGLWSTDIIARLDSAETRVTVERAFRDYGTAWSEMMFASCVATKDDGVQSAEVFALRERCLTEHREYAAELAHQLATAPHPRADGALEAASGLPSIAECANVNALRATDRPPSADLRRRMASATIEGYLHADVDPAKFQALADEAHAAGAPALESRALLLRARYEFDEAAEEHALHASALAAFAAHDDAALADAWQRLVFHTGFHAGKLAEAAAWFAYAQGAIDRLGGDPVREAELLVSRGFGEVYGGRPDDARRDMVHARELFVAARGPDYWRVAVTLSGEGAAAGAAGKSDEALALYQQARDHAKRVGGVTSQAYITATDNAANGLIATGKVDAGLALFRELDRTSETSAWRAEQISSALRTLKRFAEALDVDRHAAELSRAEKQTGPRALYPTMGIGLDLEGLSRWSEALPYLEEVLAARMQGERSPEDLAEVEFEVAKTLRATGGDAKRATALAIQARGRLEPLVAKYGQPVTAAIAEIAAWLAARK